jgi:hypothetical protein
MSTAVAETGADGTGEAVGEMDELAEAAGPGAALLGSGERGTAAAGCGRCGTGEAARGEAVNAGKARTAPALSTIATATAMTMLRRRQNNR